ncbi:hypothetical protein DFS34DRAFT_620357 [Phlyctochytrium arcticum]|nr:hypothetical protein DFS34DRAFT_620357 [Phlyctochytrium arcticum]
MSVMTSIAGCPVSEMRSKSTAPALEPNAYMLPSGGAHLWSNHYDMDLLRKLPALERHTIKRPMSALAAPISHISQSTQYKLTQEYLNSSRPSEEEQMEGKVAPELQETKAPGVSPEPASNVEPVKGLPQACLFVASLSSSKTDAQLHDSVTTHFEQWGTLLYVKVLKDWLARPYAFVQYKNVDDSKRALLEAHNTVVDGRHIRVEQARVNRTLFIAKFNKSIGPSQETSDLNVTGYLRQILERYGPVEDLTILQNYHTGRSKGCGFVKYCYREDAIRSYLGLRANYKWVAEWAANLDRGNVDVDKHSIFVGQLNQQVVTSEMLQQRYGQYGAVHSLQLINRYPSGPSSRPAFAFIEFHKESDANQAVMEENGKTWLDRTIRVQFKERNDPASSRAQDTPYNVENPHLLPGTQFNYVRPYGCLYNVPGGATLDYPVVPLMSAGTCGMY